MATSGSFDLSSGYGTIRVEWWKISHDLGANTTRLGWKATALWSGSVWYQVYAVRVWIDGQQVLNRGNSRLWGGQFASGEVTLGMNADGSRVFGANGEAAIYTAALNAWGNGSWDLPQVPRAATITGAASFNDEQNPSFTYSNPAGWAVSTLEAGIWQTDGSTSLTGYQPVNKGGNSHTINLTEEQRNTLRTWLKNRTSMTVRYYLRTVIGGADFQPYVERTVSIVNGEPVFSDFDYKDSNAATAAVTGNDKYFVQGYSRLQATISVANKMQAVKNADAVQYRYQAGAIDITQAYADGDLVKELGTLGVNSDTPLTITAIDSRGLTKSATKTLNVLPYQAPVLNPVLQRINNFETQTLFKFSATISPLKIGTTDKNAVSTSNGVQYRIKKTEATTWGAWVNVTSTTSGNTVNAADFYVNLDRNFAWDVQFKVTDKITSTTHEQVVSVGIPIMRIGLDGYVYNKEQPLMPSHVGQIVITTTLDTPEKMAAVYGGTWVRWALGRTIVGMGNNGKNNYTVVEQDFGSDNISLTTQEMPAHDHPYWFADGAATGGYGYFLQWGNGGRQGTGTWANTPAKVGGGLAHENRQASKSAYIFKRSV